MATLEERIEQLEMFRYQAIGRLNALQALVLSSAYLGLVKSRNRAATLERLQAEQEEWSRRIKLDVPEGITIDVDRLFDETRSAMEAVMHEFVKAVEERLSTAKK